MLNTTIEAIFGSTFNTDMGDIHGRGVRDSTLLATDSVAGMYQKWEAMTPSKVMEMKWNSCYDYETVIQLIRALGIPAEISRPNKALTMPTRLNYGMVPSSMGAVARSLVAKEQ
jgi:hypothetical protein